MIKIAFITPPFLGHIHPTLSIGKELIRKGYDVYWITIFENIAEIIPEGGKFIKIKPCAPDTFANLNFGMESLQGLYEGVLVPLNKYLYFEIKPYIKSENFNLIITDHQAFAGAILAHEYNIPYITSVTAPAAIEQSQDFPEIINYEHSQIVKLQQFLGFDMTEPLVCSSPLTLVYSTTYFLQNENFPPSYQFVGPSVQGRNEDEYLLKEIDHLKNSTPKVLISLGSILKFDQTFIDIVIDAFKNEEVTVILVTDPKLKDKWPQNFLVYSYIPQLKVLERVRAVICHAGYNTVCETLSFGLPVITLPIVNDQSYIATKVVKCGAGIRLKYKRLKSSHLSESLKEILSNPNYSIAAKKVMNSFIKAGGSQHAADLVEKFIIQNTSASERLKNSTEHSIICKI